MQKWKRRFGSHATYANLIRVFEHAGHKDYAGVVKQLVSDSGLYVIVVSRAQGMYGIYCTEARGREAARGQSAVNAMHPA